MNCFGPSRKAAQLEGSKEFMKDFLTRHGIPTAEYESFSDLELAIKYLQRSKVPLVIKADGLASGKGVYICENKENAENAIDEIFKGK